MIYDLFSSQQQKKYEELLKMVGSLSNLFSESNTPYLYYRVAEKIFCNAFDAKDLSRSDVSVDAKVKNVGIALKTFLAGNNNTFQKITEFGSSDRETYEHLNYREKIIRVSEIRNERINVTHRIHGIERSIYHCIARDDKRFKIYEEPLNLINIQEIDKVKQNKGSVSFFDNKNEYSFLLSKNTLTKRFNTSCFLHDFPVEIIDDPLNTLMKWFNQLQNINMYKNIIQTIYLPLYGRNHEVYPRSGLNQWNANGRTRDYNEVYIPIPAIINHNFPNFFPSRDVHFNLRLPNGNIMISKICQDGDKALMSKSNKELGKWLLRDVLNLSEGELLTYNKLQTLGIDSVRIDKIDKDNFDINFTKVGSYDEFEEKIKKC